MSRSSSHGCQCAHEDQRHQGGIQGIDPQHLPSNKRVDAVKEFDQQQQSGAGCQATAQISEKISTYITTEEPHSAGTPSLLVFELQLVELAVVPIFGQ